MAFRLLFMLLAMHFLPAKGNAQDLPIMGSQSNVSEGATDPIDETYRILVIGDALAGGVGAGLSRVVEGDGQFEIANRFQEVSGIARPEVYDWSETLPKLMEDKTFNAVLVLIGSNDRQEIRKEDLRYPFNSPDWITAYNQQTDKLLAVLKNSGMKIFWIALPPMGDARYDADMRVISDLQKQRVEAAGAFFIDLRSAFLNPDGSYASRGVDVTGATRNLRDSDGIAFTKAGNTKFGTLVLDEIKRHIEGKTDLPMTTLADPPPIIQPGATGPVFGSASQDGQFNLSTPAAAAAIGPVTSMGAPAISDTSISSRDLMPGSSAERLYVQGIAQEAPAGRFDDYRLPATAE
jgi:hypothetical protein